jgi:hypothetical protein
MKEYTFATLLWALDKSLDLVIRHIELGRYDVALERCKQTKRAIRKVLVCADDDTELIDSI